MFDLLGKTLELIIKDIYFVTGLSHRGATVNLGGIGLGGDPLNIQYYVNAYCLPGTQKSGTKIPISQITRFRLKFLVNTVVRVVSTFAVHLATQFHMHTMMGCLQIVAFD